MRVISILSLLRSMPHQYQYLIANLRLVIASSYTPFVVAEVGMNSRRARLRLTKPPNQVTRTLADPRIQWSAVLILVMVVVPNSSDCLQSRTSQSVTVQANLEGSSNIAGPGTPRGTIPTQKIQGAPPISRFQPTNITSATSSIGSRSPGTWTPLKRVDPIQGPITQDAPQFRDAENIANEDPADAVSTLHNTPVTSTAGIQKSGKFSVASSGVRYILKRLTPPKKP
jgi:hypothetical protein